MKKLMIYAMSILTVFALVGCGAKKEEAPKAEAAATTEVKPEDGAKLIVWESKGPEGEFMAMAAKKFQEKFGVPVQYAEVNMTDALTKLGQDNGKHGICRCS